MNSPILESTAIDALHPRNEFSPVAWLRDDDDVKIVMSTCSACGGRGGTYDSQGNWIKCQTCGGSGQVNY